MKSFFIGLGLMAAIGLGTTAVMGVVELPTTAVYSTDNVRLSPHE